MRFALFAVLAFACLTNVYSHPTPNRARRASSSASASSSSGDFGGLDDDSEGFGFGTGTRLNPFFPWGAFAGTYQPGAGRIGGSGCSGFGCGIQFGDFFPSFGQLFNNYDAGFSNEQQRSGFPAVAYNHNNYDNFYRQYSPQNQNYYYQNQYPYYPYYPMYNNYQYAPPTFRSPYYPQDFARMGGNPQIYFPPGAGSSSSSSSSSSNSNGNGVGHTDTFSNVNGISSRISTTRDSTGRVTTVQGGSGVPDTITTRVLKPGQSFGVYSQSGVQVNPDGNVSSYRKAGQY